MLKLVIFLIIASLSSASDSHHMMHGKTKKQGDVYTSYKQTGKAKKDAKVVYHCSCEDRNWKQSVQKDRACPYCGPSMPECGELVKILPSKKIEYDKADYDLPNKLCPVSGEEIENHKHSVNYKDMTIYLCCKKCVSKFHKVQKKGKADRYLRKLPLKPATFGFTSKPVDHEMENSMKDNKHEMDHGKHKGH